jgi:hypothetical protein
MKDRVAGPIFFCEATLTGNVHLDMTENFAVDQLPTDQRFKVMVLPHIPQ